MSSASEPALSETDVSGAARELDYDHFDVDLREDAVCVYQALRAQAHRFYTPAYGGHYVVLDHHDVYETSRRPEEFSSVSLTIPDPPVIPVVPPLSSDPPEHQKYRALLAIDFTPTRIATFRDAIRDQAADLVNGFIERGSADLMTEMIFPLTARATALFLGIEREDLPTFQRDAIELNTVLFAEPERYQEVHARVLEFYLRHIEKRRQSPQDDVASHLLAATLDGAPVPDEVNGKLHALLNGAAGETTAAGAAGMFLEIDRDPALRQRLIADADVWPSAVDEFIRYVSPIPGFSRTAMGDCPIGEMTVPHGRKVWMSYLAANHDPAVFEDPDSIVVDRHPNKHVAFGAGIHRCPGAPLARIEMQAMLEQVLTRLPDYRVTDREAAQLLPSATRLRMNLPIEFTPGARVDVAV
jgi:cytochrome P450